MKNILVGLTGSIITTILSFISRTIFINVLGSTLLGLNGLLSNVLFMLSLAELGIGNAIGFSLYKPLAENDVGTVKSLMNFYKKTYFIIGIIVFCIGLVIIPFLPIIIKEIDTIFNIYLIYFLFLLNTSYSYLFSYKRTLIVSDQKNYMITDKIAIFKFITIFFQIIYLSFGNNFIVYLLIQFSFGFFENIYLNNFINKKYPYLKEKDIKPLDEKNKKVTIKNVKALFFHKIGDYCINGTDNIIMSAFISLSVVGIYSNYNLIIRTVNDLLMIIIYGTKASFGNLIATSSKEVVYKKFKTLNFISFWFFGWATICFLFLLNPFIKLWLGEKYLLNMAIIIIVLINYFLTSMRSTLLMVKGSAGVYDEDKYVPLVQSIINLVVSLITVQYIGLIGVFIGTLVSSIYAFIARPFITFKRIFKTSTIEYFKTFVNYIIVILLNIGLVYFVFMNLRIENIYLLFIVKCIILAIIPNVLIYLLYNKSDEMRDLKNIFKNLIKSTFHKKKNI